MGNPRSAVPAETAVFSGLSGGDAGSCGEAVQRGVLSTALIAAWSFLARTST